MTDIKLSTIITITGTVTVIKTINLYLWAEIFADYEMCSRWAFYQCGTKKSRFMLMGIIIKKRRKKLWQNGYAAYVAMFMKEIPHRRNVRSVEYRQASSTSRRMT